MLFPRNFEQLLPRFAFSTRPLSKTIVLRRTDSTKCSNPNGRPNARAKGGEFYSTVPKPRARKRRTVRGHGGGARSPDPARERAPGNIEVKKNKKRVRRTKDVDAFEFEYQPCLSGHARNSKRLRTTNTPYPTGWSSAYFAFGTCVSRAPRARLAHARACELAQVRQKGVRGIVQMREEDVIWNPLIHTYIEDHPYCFVDEGNRCMLPPVIPKLSLRYRRFRIRARSLLRWQCARMYCTVCVRASRLPTASRDLRDYGSPQIHAVARTVLARHGDPSPRRVVAVVRISRREKASRSPCRTASGHSIGPQHCATASGHSITPGHSIAFANGTVVLISGGTSTTTVSTIIPKSKKTSATGGRKSLPRTTI